MNNNESSFSVQSCILRLEAVLPELKSAEHRVAAYILSNPKDVMNSTIQELAQKTNTSYATVTRLVNKIGFRGFKELKKNLYEDTLSGNSMDATDILAIFQGTSAAEINRDLYKFFADILQESCRLAVPHVMDQAADLLLSAANVNFIGTGQSALCAKYAYSQFMRIGINSFCDTDCTNYRIRTSLLGKNDVLFAISSSGRSQNILACAEMAKEQGVPIIVLSDYAISPLAKLATVNLYTTPRNSARFMRFDMPLLVGQIYLLALLFVLCCSRKGTDAENLFAQTRLAADKEKIH